MNFKPNQYFEHYLNFIHNRQVVFWNRYNQQPSNKWTVDPILSKYKFTNVYRLLDRATQYMLSDVIYVSNYQTKYTPEEMLWRIMVYKHFNLPNTWRYLISYFGDVTLALSIEDMVEALDRHHKRGYPIYSNAYMLTASFMKNEDTKERLEIRDVTRKHEAYLRVYHNKLIKEGLLNQIIEECHTMQDAFNIIRTIPMTGDFLAYQFVQDFNYTPLFNWDMNEFCAAGGGTQRGIHRVFDIEGRPDYDEIVRWTHHEFQQLLIDYNIDSSVIPLGDFWPQVPDLSNCFCETDKYMRGMGINQHNIHGKRIKNYFKPRHDKIQYTFPPKWNVKL